MVLGVAQEKPGFCQEMVSLSNPTASNIMLCRVNIFTFFQAHFTAPETPQPSGGILIENNSSFITAISRSIIIGCGDAHRFGFHHNRSSAIAVRATAG
jgi:hypothetical protein